jgi:hypothetical protein
MTTHVQHMCPKSPCTTQIYEFKGGGQLGGVCIFLEIDRAFRVRFSKTTRRDGGRVCAKFEMPLRFLGSNMNHKKKPRRCRCLALDPSLDSSIPRFTNSLALVPALNLFGSGFSESGSGADFYFYDTYLQLYLFYQNPLYTSSKPLKNTFRLFKLQIFFLFSFFRRPFCGSERLFWKIINKV